MGGRWQANIYLRVQEAGRWGGAESGRDGNEEVGYGERGIIRFQMDGYLYLRQTVRKGPSYAWPNTHPAMHPSDYFPSHH